MRDKVEINIHRGVGNSGSVKINGNEIKNVRGLEYRVSVGEIGILSLELIGSDIVINDDDAHVYVDKTTISDEWRKTSNCIR